MPKGRSHRLQPNLKRLYGYGFSLTRDADAAEELVQDTVVKALAAKSVPCDDAAYRAWLFRILRNHFIDQARRHGRFESQVSAMENGADWQYGSETEEVNALAVRIAFGQLSLNHREVIGAVDVSGLTYTEAAQLLDVPVGTIMSRISRARSALYKQVAATTSDGKLGFFPEGRRKTGAGN